MYLTLLLCLLIFLSGCLPQQTDLSKNEETKTNIGFINQEGKTLKERIKVPDGFIRVEVENESFAHFLRYLPLKQHGSKVRYYDGRIKERDVYEAVVDIDVGKRDLQQCADAVMRLRAEYLYNRKEYDKIHFNFTNGFKAEYTKWIQGYRITVEGNKANWVKTTGYSDDYQSFRKYLDIVFTYAGTLSLSMELVPVKISEMKIGDLFIRGGSPGHCVIVVDIAKDIKTAEKIFLLAQSYMPAQDIHILKNPVNNDLSPWYSIDFEDELQTPEWTFKKDELKRFKD